MRCKFYEYCRGNCLLSQYHNRYILLRQYVKRFNETKVNKHQYETNKKYQQHQQKQHQQQINI